MFKRTALLMIICFILTGNVFAGEANKLVSFTQNMTNPLLSPTGEEILFSGEDYFGLFLLNRISNEIEVITPNLNAGYGASFSPDGKWIGFKLIDRDGKQQPAIYDLASKTIVPLYKKNCL
ncbi:hypothetical protein B6I21_02630 [candidate division KSB1 bacterium 4572_119]|nr:MAG: hypothetical protein B6I21_02630 [candidate division KSB1 bacterium 4572_119]